MGRWTGKLRRRLTRGRRAGEKPARTPWGLRLAGAVALVAVCAVFPLFVSDVVGYVPLGVCLFMIALSAVYLALVSRALDCTQVARSLECRRGEANDLAVTLRNRSPFVLFCVEPTFSVSLEGEEPRRVRARAALAPHEAHGFALDMAFDHVGTYRVGLESVEVFDLVGLFSRVVPVDERCSVRVVPRVHPLGRLAGSDLSTTDVARSMSTVASDDRDYAAVRDYQLGDPMKTVHWKMSARGDERLYTKLFETHTNPATAVLLDFRSTEPSVEVRAGLYDTMLEAAFSLLECGRRSGIDTELVFFDRAGVLRAERDGSRADLDVLVDAMPRLGAGADPHLAAQLLDRVAHDPDTQANIVFCTTDLAADTVDALVRHGRGARSVRVLLAVPPAARGERRAERLAGIDRLAAARIPVTVLEDGADVAKGVRQR